MLFSLVTLSEMLQVKDIFLTPVYLIIIYIVAMYFRPKITTPLTIKYYMPALIVKLLGSIALGLVYTFYYNGGDTNNYFFHIKLVDDAFWKSPTLGLKLLFSSGQYSSDITLWSKRMFWYNSPAEFMVVRIGSVLSLLCFCTYSVIAMLFAFISFSGMWAMFRTFIKLYPNLHRQFAIALFFMPSVFFWGSGLMKDSLCLGGLGWLLFAVYRAVIERKKVVQSIVIVIVVAYPVLIMKSYILYAFMPPVLFWIINEAGSRIRNQLARRLLKPLFLVAGVGVALIGLTQLSAGDARFDLDRVAERSQITADYIYRVSIEQGGAAYRLDANDGSLGGMLRTLPQAVNVTLFRPYLWEVRNPVMLLSALESAAFLYLTISLVLRTGLFKTIKLISSVPILQLCFVFSIIFAFSVGISSYNFGTLARYKVQMMPFYLSGLYIARHLSLVERQARARAQLQTLQV